MVATVRLDSELENVLNSISKKLHKKKSDVIRDAISFYAKNLEDTKKARILSAVEKTKQSDLKEHILMEDSLHDGM